jgi:hypothetical protein
MKEFLNISTAVKVTCWWKWSLKIILHLHQYTRMKISYKLFNKVISFVPSSLSCKQILSRHATTQNMACVIVLYPFIVVYFKFSLSDKLHNGRYYVSCVVSLHKNVNIYTLILDSVFEQEQLKCDFNKWSHEGKLFECDFFKLWTLILISEYLHGYGSACGWHFLSNKTQYGRLFCIRFFLIESDQWCILAPTIQCNSFT